MRNGQLTFLSNFVTVRNFSFSQRIDSQAEYVQFCFPHIPNLGPEFFAFVKLFFSIGTIPDDNSISHESDRRSPCTLFPRRRDQSGTAFLPLLSWSRWPCIFINSNFREWINEPNAWYTTQWSMWLAKPRAPNISWSLPSCCLIWCIMKGWKSCAWITGSGCLMIEIQARWWIWLTGMWRAGGNEMDKSNVGLDHVEWELEHSPSFFFRLMGRFELSPFLFHLTGIFLWWISW